jgi:cyclase
MMFSGEPRVIPALLLSDGQLVKTRRVADPTYVGDPVNVLSIFNDFEVDEIVLLDIGAAHRRTPSDMTELRHYAEECFIPLAYGGGITDIDQISALFGSGYETVVLNTVVHDDPALVEQAAARFGSQAVVVGIDVRATPDGHRVMVTGGSVDTGVAPAAWARQAVERGAGEVLLTSIDREGTYAGFDLDLIAEVTAAVDVPVIAHGGASKRRELAIPVIEAGASAVAAGSLFVFQGADRGVLVNYPSRSQVTRLLGLG